MRVQFLTFVVAVGAERTRRTSLDAEHNVRVVVHVHGYVHGYVQNGICTQLIRSAQARPHGSCAHACGNSQLQTNYMPVAWVDLADHHVVDQ